MAASTDRKTTPDNKVATFCLHITRARTDTGSLCLHITRNFLVSSVNLPVVRREEIPDAYV